jgi:dienelactone hydrolase
MMQSTLLLICTLFLTFAATTRASIHTEAVTYKDGEVVLEGFLAYDDAIKTPMPGVLVVHDWTGLQDYAKERAKQIAALGYVAFAPDIYGKDIRPTDPKECAVCAGSYRKDLPLLRRRVITGLDQLKSRPQVDGKRLGAIGYCFGGSCVLELARSGAAVQAVVSFHGGLATTAPAAENVIKGKILICHGGADAHVNKEVPAFREEMLKSKASMEFVTYDDAQHGFTKPGPAYQEKADKESWAAMKKLFATVFNG